MVSGWQHYCFCWTKLVTNNQLYTQPQGKFFNTYKNRHANSNVNGDGKKSKFKLSCRWFGDWQQYMHVRSLFREHVKLQAIWVSKTSYLIAKKIVLQGTWKNALTEKPIKSMFSSNFEEELINFKILTNPIPA